MLAGIPGENFNQRVHGSVAMELWSRPHDPADHLTQPLQADGDVRDSLLQERERERGEKENQDLAEAPAQRCPRALTE